MTHYLHGYDYLEPRGLSHEGEADLARLRQLEPRAFVTGGIWGAATVVRHSGADAGDRGHPLYGRHEILEVDPAQYPALAADCAVRVPEDASAVEDGDRDTSRDAAAHTYAVYVGAALQLQTQSWAQAAAELRRIWSAGEAAILRMDGEEMTADFVAQLLYVTEESTPTREPTEADIASAKAVVL